MKRIVTVRFLGTTSRLYEFLTNVPLVVGGIYAIQNDLNYVYPTPVEVVSYRKASSIPVEKLRTITKTKVIKVPPQPDDGIENVYFNEKKRTTVVVWKDGVKTIVRCSPEDTYSKETGLALCYMKRMLQNRGCFNEVLKKWCGDE